MGRVRSAVPTDDGIVIFTIHRAPQGYLTSEGEEIFHRTRAAPRPVTLASEKYYKNGQNEADNDREGDRDDCPCVVSEAVTTISTGNSRFWNCGLPI